MKPLHIVALAEDELREARNWYEDQTQGAGRRLVEAVDAALVRKDDHGQTQLPDVWMCKELCYYNKNGVTLMGHTGDLHKRVLGN